MSYVHHTILLIDADQDMAHFAMLALQRVGVITPIQAVRSADEAMAYLGGSGAYADRESYPLPALILFDPGPPDLCGLEFLNWLRLQPVIRRTPVIVLAQPGCRTEVARAYEFGCNSYLLKPTSFNTLLVMMQSLVQFWLGHNTWPEAVTDPSPVVAAGAEQVNDAPIRSGA